MTKKKASKETTEIIESPSLLSFSRKLEVSDALMKSGKWSDRKDDSKWHSIKIYEKRNRGTKSYHGAEEKDKEKSNISYIDDATLPHDADTLKVTFTLKILGNLGEPSSCNNPDWEKEIQDKVDNYKTSDEFATLVERYAYNIANARFLWRNRVGAEDISVRVECLKEKKYYKFDELDLPLGEFLTDKAGDNFKGLADLIAEGLKGNGYKFIKVTAYSKLGCGQRVWPSQEMMIVETSKNNNSKTVEASENNKSKTLFQIEGCAAMHSEKIGNALRTVDTWYREEGKDKGEESPIAAEPYGSVIIKGIAHRKSGNDFYTLLDQWVKENKDKDKDEWFSSQKHYIVSVLIRGGVFNYKKGKSKQ